MDIIDIILFIIVNMGFIFIVYDFKLYCENKRKTKNHPKKHEILKIIIKILVVLNMLSYITGYIAGSYL